MNFTRKVLICSTLFLIPLMTNAAVELHTPENIVLLSVNDQDVKSGFLGGKKSYQLDAGTHELTVRYQEFFDLPNNEHDVVKSSTVLINTPVLKDGQRYQLQLLNAPKTHDEAKDYAKQPQIGLLNAGNETIAQNKVAVRSPGLIQQIFSPTQNLTVASTSVQPVTTELKAHEKNSQVQQSNDQKLIELWKQATPLERQKFTAWLAGQAN